MRVLILSISTGQGHHQCASALQQYLIEQRNECVTVDALEYINTVLSKSVSQSYLFSTQYSPNAYGQIYRMAEKKGRPTSKITLSSITTAPLSRKISKLIKNYEPDVIVCTHVYTAMLMSVLKNITANTVGIVTDFTIHPFWENTSCDYYVTAHELLYNQTRKKQLPDDSILATGIPILPKFANKTDKAQARKLLGIPDKRTVLIMSGSMGYGNILKYISKLDRLEGDFQIISVCGRNNKARRLIDSCSFDKKVYNHGYVDNVDIFMDACDIMITKPGGLTSSEALAKKVPMILMNPIPGQEDRNAEFLINNGAAMLTTSTFPVDECVYQLINSPCRLELMKQAANDLAKPYAAKNLGDFLNSL